MAPEILVAKTFFRSTSELEPRDARRINDFLQKMIANPTHPGIGLERIKSAPDPNMWSARVNRELRAILHHDGNRYTLLHVARHDDAYAWAERRRVGPHPVTGAIQIVEIPEVQAEPEPSPPSPTAAGTDDNLNFGRLSAEYLLSLGVPEEWIPAVQRIRTQDDFWPVHEKLPEEPGELLFALALGEEVKPPRPVSPRAKVSANPDNLRRLHIVAESEELEQLLTKPFEDWMLYLHPSQRHLAQADFNGPVKVTGAAGTGKTVVAMHRARHLARQGRRVLLTTFSRRLSENILRNIRRLCSDEERGRITVGTVHSRALRMLRQCRPSVAGLNSDSTREWLENSLPPDLMGLSEQFVFEEWQYAVDQQGLMTWDEYLEVSRVGRGTPLGPAERERVWSMFAPVLSELEEADSFPWSIVCRKAREAIESGDLERPFDAVVIDEVQDLNVQEVRFLAAMACEGPNNLVLIGDAGQRIYPGGFSLRSMGIEVRGRSRVLKVNYRTTREIAGAASHLRDQTVDDLDGETEMGGGIQTLLSGKAPIMRGFNRYEEENEFVGERVAELISGGTRPSEIAVFARLKRKRYWFEEELKRRSIPICIPDQREDDNIEDGVYMSTMHGAKGMEFRFVFIVGCEQGQVPAQAPIGMASDEMEKKAALQREKNLLYVSMTRAREQLYVTWTGWPSEFLGIARE